MRAAPPTPSPRRPRAEPLLGEARRLRRAIQALVRRFSVSERADVSCCGMTIAQAATLAALAAEGSLRLSELGSRLGIAPSTLTRNLGRLEGRGLLRSRPDRQDARSSRVELTASGRRKAEVLDRQEERFAAAILQRVTPRNRRRLVADVEELVVAVTRATASSCPGAFDHLLNDLPRDRPGAARSIR